MKSVALRRFPGRARGLAAAVALALILPLLAALPARAADSLEPFRALVRTPAGARLLEIAREAMRGADVTTITGQPLAGEWREAKVSTKDPARPAADLEFPPPPAALYVTLQSGRTTRACVGHDPPQGADLAEAVRTLAAQVRTGDRRRPPVRDEELGALRIVIGFAAPAEAVANAADVDPGREGLLIATDRGRVAFLPGEARTVAWALREARRIGVLGAANSPARYFRFDVVTLSEAAPAAAQRKDSDVHP